MAAFAIFFSGYFFIFFSLYYVVLVFVLDENISMKLVMKNFYVRRSDFSSQLCENISTKCIGTKLISRSEGFSFELEDIMLESSRQSL